MVEPQYVIKVDGADVPAGPDQTVAAAMITAGIVWWRRTRRYGRPRGLFCGIGACFDCLVRVDGGPPVRACLTPVQDGMIIDTDRDLEGEAQHRALSLSKGQAPAPRPERSS